MVLAVVVFYTATAELSNDLGRIHLPLFTMAGHTVEAGNAVAGRGHVLHVGERADARALQLRDFAPRASVGRLGRLFDRDSRKEKEPVEDEADNVARGAVILSVADMHFAGLVLSLAITSTRA